MDQGLSSDKTAVLGKAEPCYQPSLLHPSSSCSILIETDKVIKDEKIMILRTGTSMPRHCEERIDRIKSSFVDDNRDFSVSFWLSEGV